MNFFYHANPKNDILLIAVGIVGALAALSIISPVFLGTLNTNASNGDSSNYSNTQLTIEAKKAQILAAVQMKSRLTSTEKEEIGNAIVGDKVKMYHFTNDEVSRIVRALNARD